MKLTREARSKMRTSGSCNTGIAMGGEQAVRVVLVLVVLYVPMSQGDY